MSFRAAPRQSRFGGHLPAGKTVGGKTERPWRGLAAAPGPPTVHQRRWDRMNDVKLPSAEITLVEKVPVDPVPVEPVLDEPELPDVVEPVLELPESPSSPWQPPCPPSPLPVLAANWPVSVVPTVMVVVASMASPA